MQFCPYGACTMLNLCKGSHCVRKALEKDGYKQKADGTVERVGKEFYGNNPLLPIRSDD